MEWSHFLSYLLLTLVQIFFFSVFPSIFVGMMYSGCICLIFLIVQPASKLYVESMTMRLLKSESCEALGVRSSNCCGDHYKTRRGNIVLA